MFIHLKNLIQHLKFVSFFANYAVFVDRKIRFVILINFITITILTKLVNILNNLIVSGSLFATIVSYFYNFERICVKINKFMLVNA